VQLLILFRCCGLLGLEVGVGFLDLAPVPRIMLFQAGWLRPAILQVVQQLELLVAIELVGHGSFSCGADAERRRPLLHLFKPS
jgi:hypothetical protein